jgi:hypothetical protein
VKGLLGFIGKPEATLIDCPENPTLEVRLAFLEERFIVVGLAQSALNLHQLPNVV